VKGTKGRRREKVQNIDSREKQVCFHCKEPLEETSAYITSYMFPVCDECLQVLCEEYFWEADNLEIRKIRPKKLENLHTRTQEEIEHQFRTALYTLPILIEREAKLKDDTLIKLAGMPEIQGIPLLEG